MRSQLVILTPRGTAPLSSSDALNGVALDGDALNGVALDGDALNGVALNGDALNGVALDGDALDGVARRKGMNRLAGPLGTAVVADPAGGQTVGQAARPAGPGVNAGSGQFARSVAASAVTPGDSQKFSIPPA